MSALCAHLSCVCVCVCVCTDRTAPYLFDQYFAFHSLHVHVCLPDFSEHIEMKSHILLLTDVSLHHCMHCFSCIFSRFQLVLWMRRETNAFLARPAAPLCSPCLPGVSCFLSGSSLLQTCVCGRVSILCAERVNAKNRSEMK